MPLTHTAAQSGDWAASATWNSATLPSLSGSVRIPGGTIVTLPFQTSAMCSALTCSGLIGLAGGKGHLKVGSHEMKFVSVGYKETTGYSATGKSQTSPASR